MLVYSTDNSSTEQLGSRACQRPWCHTCNYISPVAEIRGPKCFFFFFASTTISPANPEILFTAYPAANALFFTLEKPGEA